MASRTSRSARSPQSRAPKISKKDVEEAEAFLANTPAGKRLQYAEHTLTLLARNRLPRLRQFLFNAGFDLREMRNPDQFEHLIATDESRNELVKASRCKGYIQVGFEKEQIRLTLFYGEEPSEKESQLYAKSIGEVTSVTYAILGLEMRGHSETPAAALPANPG